MNIFYSVIFSFICSLCWAQDVSTRSATVSAISNSSITSTQPADESSRSQTSSLFTGTVSMGSSGASTTSKEDPSPEGNPPANTERKSKPGNKTGKK
jgi:hypothetical protein